ncbi:MAG: flavodoxin-dependent (E)-4-hydroxy-3-methylbut-2-enyl-diphosphate synthase [archaeon]|nr:flavodoxin-dependent (E)-4-hydroxy-3-methylbut-2-enyl-diphosphate synthase [archaeon]
MFERKKTIEVKVGNIGVGGHNPVRVQSMTNTNTADVDITIKQIKELFEAGSELVRFTVQNDEMAQAVPEIKKRLLDEGIEVPLIGDFHFNGHALLTQYPKCAEALDKLRINPGNVGKGEKHDPNFETFIKVAVEYDKPVRIGVNWGSLDQDLFTKMMDENSALAEPLEAQEVLNDAMIASAINSTNAAIQLGLEPNKIIISAKISEVPELIKVYRKIATLTNQPLHLGLTEAGMGDKGIVASSIATGTLLQDGIGDTIRVSTTPRPNQSRADEVIIANQILQVLGVRKLIPTVTSCPGCGRTSSTLFQELSEETNIYLMERLPFWKKEGYAGVEGMKVAVMGCVVNGPGESKAANIGLSLPGRGENPNGIVYVDGKLKKTLIGKTISEDFKKLIEDYVLSHYGKKEELITIK